MSRALPSRERRREKRMRLAACRCGLRASSFSYVCRFFVASARRNNRREEDMSASEAALELNVRTEKLLQTVVRRDGTEIPYDRERISSAIERAFRSDQRLRRGGAED